MNFQTFRTYKSFAVQKIKKISKDGGERRRKKIKKINKGGEEKKTVSERSIEMQTAKFSSKFNIFCETLIAEN